MAKEKDEDADREPESKGGIHERRQRKAEISSRYTEAKSKLPDDSVGGGVADSVGDPA